MPTSSHALPTLELANDILSLLLTQTVGPRILSLRYRGGENLFAELPNLITETSVGTYHFYGGHRLWRAPEDLTLTYFPDDDPVDITPLEQGLQIVQPPDPAGLQKSIALHLEGATVTLTHTLTNHSPTPIVCAPWAITQFKPGGVAILPQVTDNTGLLPNRQIALWPYTDICSPHIVWGNQYILVQANVPDGALKLGFPSPRGWLAYWREGTLFVKKAAFDPQATYLDYGSSSECYCNDQFLELETLGGVTTLTEGASATHVETWEVYGDVEKPVDETAVEGIVKKYRMA